MILAIAAHFLPRWACRLLQPGFSGIETGARFASASAGPARLPVQLIAITGGIEPEPKADIASEATLLAQRGTCHGCP